MVPSMLNTELTSAKEQHRFGRETSNMPCRSSLLMFLQGSVLPSSLLSAGVQTCVQASSCARVSHVAVVQLAPIRSTGVEALQTGFSQI